MQTVNTAGGSSERNGVTHINRGFSSRRQLSQQKLSTLSKRNQKDKELALGLEKQLLKQLSVLDAPSSVR